jgi:hypothetical protein
MFFQVFAQLAASDCLARRRTMGELFEEEGREGKKPKVERIAVATYLSKEDYEKLAFLARKVGGSRSEVLKRLIRFGYKHAKARERGGAA